MLTTLIETLPPSERYTYVFEGNSQALDHMLVSDELLRSTIAGYDVVHVNAEFADAGERPRSAGRTPRRPRACCSVGEERMSGSPLVRAGPGTTRTFSRS